MRDRCLRCGDEPFDESDLCEDCLDLISFGEMLRGDHGEAERREARESVSRSFFISNPTKQIRRLIGIAQYWRGEWARPYPAHNWRDEDVD